MSVVEEFLLSRIINRSMSIRRLVVILIAFLLAAHSALAQNTPQEIGVWFAPSGQIDLLKNTNGNNGFFQNAFVGRIHYSFASNGIQSLAVTLEQIGETRAYDGRWDVLDTRSPTSFQAHVSEQLHMTTIGLETNRTILSESGFRLGGGLGSGVSLGNAHATVTDVTTLQTTDHPSNQAWGAINISANLRARYSVYTSGNYDVGVVAAARYWAFPLIGPLGPSPEDYNGPALRSIHELGYLVGLVFGF